MQDYGLIPDVRQIGFGEPHALCYACLVLTGRVRETSRLEKLTRHVAANGRTTERTIRRCLGNKPKPKRDSLTAQILRQILEEAL
jgi:hypothetical protein